MSYLLKNCRSNLLSSFLVLLGGLACVPKNVSAYEVTVPAPPAYSYNSEEVYQLKVRGEYGRYLTFVGRSINDYSGSPSYYDSGSPGKLNCTTRVYGSTGYTDCNRVGYRPPKFIPGTAGGLQRGLFRYELDCEDRTYDRKNDRANSYYRKGWMSIRTDPTALAVASRFCPIRKSLRKVYLQDGRYVMESTEEERKARLVALAMAKKDCLHTSKGMDGEKATLLSINALHESGISPSDAVSIVKSSQHYQRQYKLFAYSLDKKTCELDITRYQRYF